MSEHELKTWPDEYQAIVDGRKAFEWRKNDRDFATGNLLWLREWDPAHESYTGREVWRRVTYVLRGPSFGVPEGFAVLSLGEP